MTSAKFDDARQVRAAARELAKQARALERQAYGSGGRLVALALAVTALLGIAAPLFVIASYSNNVPGLRYTEQDHGWGYRTLHDPKHLFPHGVTGAPMNYGIELLILVLPLLVLAAVLVLRGFRPWVLISAVAALAGVVGVALDAGNGFVALVSFNSKTFVGSVQLGGYLLLVTGVAALVSLGIVAFVLRRWFSLIKAYLPRSGQGVAGASSPESGDGESCELPTESGVIRPCRAAR